MITILRGALRDRRAYCVDAASRSTSGIYLSQPPDMAIPWYGVRAVIARVREWNAPRVDEALSRHRAAASLVLRRGIEDLTAEERAERSALRAHLDSHLSHNGLLSAPLVAAWREILRAATVYVDCSIIIPDLSSIDATSITVLRSLYLLHPDHPASLIVGYDPGDPVAEPEPDGVVWRTPRSLVFAAVAGLRVRDGARTIDVAAKSTAPAVDELAAKRLDVSPIADEDDVRTMHAAFAGDAPLSAGEAAMMVIAIRYAFANYSFASVVRLGGRLLPRQSTLTAADRADVHAMIALAAHNLHLRSTSDRHLATFIEGHLAAALAVEARVTVRASLLYRMAVTLGRRMNQLEPALKCADEMIRMAGADCGDPVTAMVLEAWGRNIRGYLLMRRRDPAGAARECEAALSLLGRAEGRLQGLARDSASRWTNEVALSKIVVLENLIQLSIFAKDVERRLHWQKLASAIQERFPGTKRLQALDWMELYRWVHRADMALPLAAAGAEAARAEGDIVWHHDFSLHAADLHDRLGRPADAARLFAIAERLRSDLGDPQELTPAEVEHADACIRAGMLGEANEIVTRALAKPAYRSPVRRARATARLALIAAIGGDGDRADSMMNAAIDLAVDSGVRDLLVDVAITAARACQILDRMSDARDAFRRAGELARAAPTGTRVQENAAGAAGLSAAAARGLVEAAVGIHECGERDVDALAACLPHVSLALDTVETWWLLPKLLPILAAHPAVARRATGSIEALVAAASQRSDCTDGLTRLFDVLPEARAAAVAPIAGPRTTAHAAIAPSFDATTARSAGSPM